ncbi:MAG TPA: hypothetical protein VKQ32_27700 [Polyangia bacterium]|nr:hypothetical protein [Polyangia bacterium]
MNALRRRLLKLATLLGAFTILWACNAPFIPVPPPGATFTSQLVDDGMGTQKTVWVTHGLPSMNAALATYYVYNERLGTGIIATAGPDGTFTGMPMDGVENDHIDLSYRTPNGDYSDSLCLLLTTALGSGGVSAPSCRP